MPSEYGLDNNNPEAQELAPAFKEKGILQAYLREKESSGLTSTAIACEMWIGWSLRNNFLGLDYANRTIILTDDGTGYFSTTTLANTALALNQVLLHPGTTSNQIVFTSDLARNQQELVATIERLTGEPWQRKSINTAEAIPALREAWRCGDAYAGYGLINIGFTKEHKPFEIKSLTRRTRQVFELVDNTKTVGQARGQGFMVPKNIDHTGIHETNTHSLKVETGTELSNSLDAGAEVSASYGGISAEGSVKYSYQTVLSASKYSGILSTKHQSFMLIMKLPHGKLDLENGFVESSKELPEWLLNGEIKSPKLETYEEYKAFSLKGGTYLIRACSSRARYQLTLESHTTDAKSESDFKSHISTEYNGIASTYERIHKFQAKVIGGDPDKNAELSSSPDKAAKFDDWKKSISDSTADDPISLEVMSLGHIVAECKDLDKAARKTLST
ncbi:hypothetical protein BBP40_009516 [Aspergillus hancockii]|nr:hypothetical protein BBP40_009516 [Aspergillus hancockii]